MRQPFLPRDAANIRQPEGNAAVGCLFLYTVAGYYNDRDRERMLRLGITPDFHCPRKPSML